MNILHLISSGGMYGAERVVLDLACYSVSRGVRARVGVIESPGAEMLLRALREKGVESELIQVGRTGLPGVVGSLRRRIREHGVELVHSHGYRSDVLAALLTLGSPVLRVATCHAWCSDSLRLHLYELIDKWTLRLFHHVVVVSPQLYDEVSRAGVERSRITLVHNGVEMDPGGAAGEGASLRERYGVEEGNRLLLRVGRLDRNKGNEILLEAFARSFRGQGVNLMFVGEGEDLGRLRRLAADLGVGGQVIFTGYQRNVGRFLQEADLVVISSYSEGLPLVLLEGIALGKPIVSTAVGAIGDVIEHRGEGWLVPPGDVTALAHGMRVLVSDTRLADRLGAAGQRRYLENHTVSSMGRRYHAIYRSLLQRGGAP